MMMVMMMMTMMMMVMMMMIMMMMVMNDALIYSLGNQQFDPVTPQGRNIHLSSISKYRNSVIYKNPARDRMHIENVNAVAVRLQSLN